VPAPGGPGAGRLPERPGAGHAARLPRAAAGAVARGPGAVRHAVRGPLRVAGLQAAGAAHLVLGAVPAAAARLAAALLRVPLPADGAGAPLRRLLLAVLRRAGAGAAGARLPRHRGVRGVAGGHAALHPVPGAGSAGGPAAAARLLPQGGAQHGRSQPLLQRGPPQVGGGALCECVCVFICLYLCVYALGGASMCVYQCVCVCVCV